MAKYTHSQNSFISGELSPKLKGRNDVQQYLNGVETMENFHPYISGGVVSRKGTEYLYKLPNVSSTAEDILYFRPLFGGIPRYFKLYANGSNEYSCVEITKDANDNLEATATTVLYSNTVFTHPKTLQIGNLLFVTDSLGVLEPLVILFDGTDIQVHTYTGYMGIVLNPLSNTAKSTFLAHPLRPNNVTDTTVTITSLAASTGVLTFSKAIEIEQAGYIVISDGTTESVFFIDTKTSDTVYAVTEIIVGSGTLIAGYVTTAWALSIWYFGNYPTSCSLFQERFILGGGYLTGLDTMNFSFSNNLFLMLNRKLLQDHTADVSGLNYFGAIADADAFSVLVGSSTLEKIYWIKADRVVQVGTELREHVIAPVDGIIGPNNKNISVSTEYGSGNADAVKFQNSTYFIGSTGQNLRSLKYSDENGSNVSMLLSSLADHMVEEGATLDTYTFSRLQIHKETNTLWVLNSSKKVLIGLKIDDSTGILAWFRYVISGADSIDSFSVMTFDSSATASLSSSFNDTPILVLKVARGADTFLEYIVCGGEPKALTSSNIGTVFRQSYTYMDFTHRPLTVVSGVTTFPAHLANETLNFVIKGVDEGDLALDGSAQIDLTSYGVTDIAEVHIGLLFDSILKTMPIDQGSQTGNGQVQISRIDQVLLRVFRSKPCQLGSSEPNVYDVDFPTLTDLELYTGDVRVELDSTPGETQQVVVKSNKPYPLSILSIGMRGVTQD